MIECLIEKHLLLGFTNFIFSLEYKPTTRGISSYQYSVVDVSKKEGALHEDIIETGATHTTTVVEKRA